MKSTHHYIKITALTEEAVVTGTEAEPIVTVPILVNGRRYAEGTATFTGEEAKCIVSGL